MEMRTPIEIAIETFGKLGRITGSENGLYRHMQIAPSEHHRFYICCCSLFSGYYIVHDEFDVNSKMSHFRVLSEKKTIKYIKSFSQSFQQIQFVGIYEDDGEEIVIKYKI